MKNDLINDRCLISKKLQQLPRGIITGDISSVQVLSGAPSFADLELTVQFLLVTGTVLGPCDQTAIALPVHKGSPVTKEDEADIESASWKPIRPCPTVTLKV